MRWCHVTGPAGRTSCISSCLSALRLLGEGSQDALAWEGGQMGMEGQLVPGGWSCRLHKLHFQLAISFQIAGRGISGCASLGGRAGENAKAACAERLVLQAAAAHQLPDCRKRDLRMRRPGREGRRECQGSLCWLTRPAGCTGCQPEPTCRCRNASQQCCQAPSCLQPC